MGRQTPPSLRRHRLSQLGRLLTLLSMFCLYSLLFNTCISGVATHYTFWVQLVTLLHRQVRNLFYTNFWSPDLDDFMQTLQFPSSLVIWLLLTYFLSLFWWHVERSDWVRYGLCVTKTWMKKILILTLKMLNIATTVWHSMMNPYVYTDT